MHHTVKKISLLSALMLSAVFVIPSFAAEGGSSTFTPPHRSSTMGEYKPSFGIQVGLASPDVSDRRNSVGWGIEYAVQPIVPFSSAIQLNGFSNGANGFSPSLTRTELLYKAAYNFGGDIPVIKDSYAGLLLGPVFDNIANKMDVEFGLAPVIGFDIPIGDSHYSLGANANYMFVGGPNNDVFALNGAAKYWF